MLVRDSPPVEPLSKTFYLLNPGIQELMALTGTLSIKQVFQVMGPELQCLLRKLSIDFQDAKHKV